MLQRIQVRDVMLAGLYFLVGCLGFMPGLITPVTILILIAIVCFSLKKELFKLAPMFLFFNSTILYFNGMALVDVYYLAYIVSFFCFNRKLCLQPRYLLLLMFALYSLTVIISFDLATGIKVFLSFLFLFLLLQDISSSGKWDVFCQFYVVALFTATLFGIKVYIDALKTTLYGQIPRYLLSFTDPNYAGLFLTVGFYILLFKEEAFDKTIRWIGMLLCMLSVLITISSSTIICNVLVVCFWGAQKIKSTVDLKRRIKTLTVGIIAIGMIYIMAENFFPGVLRTVERFREKLTFLGSGDIALATTDRSNVWMKHLDLFWNQTSIWKSLFGGYYLTDRGFDARYFTAVSHQLYVDSLLCFGIFGTGLLVATIVREFVRKWKVRMAGANGRVLMTILLIWLIYSFILSMFPFWAFSMLLLVSVPEKGEQLA